MCWKPKFADLTNIGSQKEIKSNDGNQSETLSDIDYSRSDDHHKDILLKSVFDELVIGAGFKLLQEVSSWKCSYVIFICKL